MATVYYRTKDGFVLRWTQLLPGKAAIGQPNMALTKLEVYEFKSMQFRKEKRREHHGAVLEIRDE